MVPEKRQTRHVKSRAHARAAAERTRVARVIGRRKSSANQPVQDPRQEARVLALARERAEALGLSAGTAERLIAILIEEAVTLQRSEQRAPARDAEPA